MENVTNSLWQQPNVCVCTLVHHMHLAGMTYIEHIVFTIIFDCVERKPKKLCCTFHIQYLYLGKQVPLGILFDEISMYKVFENCLCLWVSDPLINRL